MLRRFRQREALDLHLCERRRQIQRRLAAGSGADDQSDVCRQITQSNKGGDKTRFRLRASLGCRYSIVRSVDPDHQQCIWRLTPEHFCRTLQAFLEEPWIVRCLGADENKRDRQYGSQFVAKLDERILWSVTVGVGMQVSPSTITVVYEQKRSL